MHGNIINRVQEHSLSPEPRVGMGATIYMWSDRLAATITAIKGKTITLTEDDVTEWKGDYGVSFVTNRVLEQL